MAKKVKTLFEQLKSEYTSTCRSVKRYSSKKNGKFNGTIDLGATYRLDTLNLYIFENDAANAGENFKIEVYSDGQWTTVKTIATTAELEKFLVTNGGGGVADWMGEHFSTIMADLGYTIVKASLGNNAGMVGAFAHYQKMQQA